MATGDNSFRIADLDLLDPHDAARAVQGILAGRETYRRDYDRSFYTNVRFLEGGVRQWYEWRGDKFDLDARMKNKQVITANVVLEIVESMVSRLMPPGNSVEAGSVTSDREDINKSRLLTDVLNYYRNRSHSDVQLAHALLTMCCSPVCWQTGGWSQNRGPLIRTSLEDFLAVKIEGAFPYGIDQADDIQRRQVLRSAAREFADIFGERALNRREVVQRSGDLFTETVTIPEMSWYPWVPTTWDDVQYYVRSRLTPFDVIAEREGLTIEEVRRRCAGDSKHGLRRSFGRLSETSPARYRLMDVREGANTEQGEYHQFFRVPCEAYPEGVQGVVLGSDSEAVRVGPIDNYRHRVPFFPLVQHVIPDQAVGTCVVSQIRTQQVDLNQSLQRRAFRRDLYSFPPIGVPVEGIYNERDWKVQLKPAYNFKYRNGAAPKAIDLPNVNIADETTISSSIAMMRELSSVSSLSVGEADRSGVKSGRAINSLDEKTLQRLDGQKRRIIAQQTDLCQFQAEELIHKPIGDQIAQIAGRDNQYETIDWRADELQPSTYGTPNRQVALITIAPFSDLPMTGVERRNFVMGIVKAGILDPKTRPQDREEAMRLLSIGEHRKTLERGRVDEATARWEIRQWVQGMPTELPHENEDHAKQIDVHTEWMRGPEYRALIRALPWMEAIIDQHIRAHRKLAYIKAARAEWEPMIARAEAWQLVQREAALDAQTGVLDPQIYQMLPAGTGPGQMPLMMDISSVVGGMGPMGGVAGPSGPAQGGAGPGGAPSPGGGANGGSRQRREFVGEENGRDTRRDLSDAGVNDLVAQA